VTSVDLSSVIKGLKGPLDQVFDSVFCITTVRIEISDTDVCQDRNQEKSTQACRDPFGCSGRHAKGQTTIFCNDPAIVWIGAVSKQDPGRKQKGVRYVGRSAEVSQGHGADYLR
jgi:hypothetical protein